MSANESVTAHALVRQVREYDRPPQFIPGRYPYTYAADFMRQHPHVIPEEAFMGTDPAGMSRARASVVRAEWARMVGMEESRLAEILADAALELAGITPDWRSCGGVVMAATPDYVDPTVGPDSDDGVMPENHRRGRG